VQVFPIVPDQRNQKYDDDIADKHVRLIEQG